MRCRRFLLLLGILFLSPLVGSDEPSEVDQTKRKIVRLSLRHVTALALANNHDINLRRIDPLIARSDEIRALANFDPSLASQLNYTREHQRTSSILSGGDVVRQDTTSFTFGLRRTTPIGTRFDLDYSVERFESNNSGSVAFQNFLIGSNVENPSYTSKFTLRVTQPLLRNFGLASNMSDVRTARSQSRSAHALFEDEIRKTVSTVLQTYWELVQYSDLMELENRSLRRAHALLAITQAKLKGGTAEPLQLISSEVEVARKEADVLAAQEKLLKVEDHLKQLIMPDSLEHAHEVLLVPIEDPKLRKENTELAENIRQALEARPDLLALREKIEQARYQVERARNQLLPALNAHAEGGWSGTAKSMAQSIKDLSGGSIPTWGFGMEFELPFGNRAARSTHRKARLELRKAQLLYEKKRVAIIAEVRLAVRALSTNQSQITVNHKARKLAEKQLEIEIDRFRRGLTRSNKTVIDFQEELNAVRRQEIQTLISYKNALVRLQLTRGTSVREFLQELPIH
ncbi:MAG: TolC family protein [Planctomycetota bacterium]|nr:TolC family protein [Planctomycetota bacterium]